MNQEMVFDRVVCHFELSFRNIGYEMAMAELQLRYFGFNIFTWMIGSLIIKLNHNVEFFNLRIYKLNFELAIFIHTVIAKQLFKIDNMHNRVQ